MAQTAGHSTRIFAEKIKNAMKHKVSSISSFEISKGFNARLIHTDNLTLAYVDIDDGAALAEHSHVHEQVVNVLEGRFELTVAGRPHVLEAGDVFALASNVPHSGRVQPRPGRF